VHTWVHRVAVNHVLDRRQSTVERHELIFTAFEVPGTNPSPWTPYPTWVTVDVHAEESPAAHPATGAGRHFG
jgi:hypothetical protein